MSRGVLYIVWPGDEKRTDAALQRSIRSIEEWHPELPYHIHRLPADATMLDRAQMVDWTPFDETLFLDADTVVLDRLDLGFEKAAKHDLALCICECPWARRYSCITGDQVEFNAGVLWFTKAAKPVFDRWLELNRTIDSSILFKNDRGELNRMPHNDQAGLSLAIEQMGFNPYVLPMNFNFRPIWHKTWFGTVKLWHDYSAVPADLIRWNAMQRQPGAVVEFAGLA